MKKKLLFLLSTLMLENSFAQSDTTFNVTACDRDSTFININGSSVTQIGGNASQISMNNTTPGSSYVQAVLTDLNGSGNQNLVFILRNEVGFRDAVLGNGIQTGSYRFVLYTSPTDSTVVTWNVSNCD